MTASIESLKTLTQNHSWLIAFLAQINPLIGPTVKNTIAGHMRKAWSSNPVDYTHPCELIV